MKLTQRQKQLKKFVTENFPPDSTKRVPLDYSTVMEMWLEKSGGLEPDEVDPERHEQLISIVAGALNADQQEVADMIVDWGSATSMGPMRTTETIKINVGQLRNLINEVMNKSMLNEEVDPTRVKRGQILLLGPKEIPVKFVKKFGPERPNYLIVQLPNGNRTTVWASDLQYQVSDMLH